MMLCVFDRAQGVAMLETGVADRQCCAADVERYPGKQWANDAIRGDSEQVSGSLSGNV